jgi:hypothetical protein
MTRSVVLLVLAALWLGACAETNRSNAVVQRAATCAMCGASVSPGYLYYSTERAAGPSEGW